LGFDSSERIVFFSLLFVLFDVEIGLIEESSPANHVSDSDYLKLVINFNDMKKFKTIVR
jgi:hypothetical protein